MVRAVGPGPGPGPGPGAAGPYNSGPKDARSGDPDLDWTFASTSGRQRAVGDLDNTQVEPNIAGGPINARSGGIKASRVARSSAYGVVVLESLYK
ncbi:hypothetical protein PHLCEN_2v9794 [Hermanssonia centrifuga]|uniref:Uncharacterized protein n=1 Tax=Hermanssonia centrifuga TaxID=98765 RepID=A0A2R6NPQ8_9APHY|nr:hypothetical protein PHLCEN_2v9794 [Hermanssonia centrifuga]